jgi:hypothetical protein
MAWGKGPDILMVLVGAEHVVDRGEERAATATIAFIGRGGS